MKPERLAGFRAAFSLLLPLSALLSPAFALAQSPTATLSVRVVAEAVDSRQLMGILRAGISRESGGPCFWYPIDVDDRMQIHYSKLNPGEIVFNGELLAVAAEICLQAPGYAEYRSAVGGQRTINANLLPEQPEPVSSNRAS